MLLQFTISPPLHQQLSGFPSFTLPRSVNYRKHSITCSISQIHSYGTVDYERRPLVKWNAVYRRISLMENPEMGSASVLNQWENEGKRLTKWELCRVVKELRKFKRFKMALELTYLCWLLMCFETFFRLKVNLEKSELIPVGSVKNVDELAKEFGFRLRLEQIQRDILWGEGALEQKSDLVQWAIIYSDKSKGRLGVRYLTSLNKAFLRDLFGKKSLAKNVGEEEGGWRSSKVRDGYRFGLWKAIRKDWDLLGSKVTFSVGNGRRGLLGPHFSKRLNDWEIDLVERFFLRLQTWRVSSDKEDRLVWAREKSGTFFVEALYKVYEWMNNRGERFRLSSSDAAIQLDLIAKVCGVSSAEDYFSRLPDTLKDKRIYGALLNAYVQAKMRDKAEILIEKLRNKGYATTPLPFNVMMTLYMNLKELDKVQSMISEMMNKNIQLDIYSYNIWLSSCESTERMEQVFEQMKLERTINPNWTTFSTMATMYIKLGQFEKAEECLKKVESRITNRDRMPYHYLISLYGSTGNKAEVYRAWNIYKSKFPNIPNLGYHALISSLVRVGDLEGAEKIYEEWLSVKSSYDPRIGNLLLGCYVKEGFLEKAEGFLDHMIEAGGKPNSTTWEILAEGNTGVKKISDALSCFKRAVLAEGSNGWKPKPVNVSAFLDLCEEEADTATKEALMGLLRQMGCLEDEPYASLFGLHTGSVTGNELSNEKDRTGADKDIDEDEDDGAEMLLNQFQSGL
uniref:Pentatricopeptide repeat-containing protein n=2 Tax=Vitis vinifera TaxID=29760 RepID=A5C6T5_VITVI|nr:hypothetical protein VITISV_002476 [Vitis vinifera]